MPDPIPGVVYTRIHPNTTWTALGRPSLPGSTAVYPADDLFPSDSLYPAGDD